jgi:hypothetical protein
MITTARPRTKFERQSRRRSCDGIALASKRFGAGKPEVGQGGQRLNRELRDLIRRMARENPRQRLIDMSTDIVSRPPQYGIISNWLGTEMVARPRSALVQTLDNSAVSQACTAQAKPVCRSIPKLTAMSGRSWQGRDIRTIMRVQASSTSYGIFCGVTTQSKTYERY